MARSPPLSPQPASGLALKNLARTWIVLAKKNGKLLRGIDNCFGKIRGPPKRRLWYIFQACTHAALPDFLTFRQPCSYQKLPLEVHWLLSLQRQPKVITLCVYKLAMDLRSYADFGIWSWISCLHFTWVGLQVALFQMHPFTSPSNWIL